MDAGVPRASVSRARNADCHFDAYPWRAHTCSTFHASEGGLWGRESANGTTRRWDARPLEGFAVAFGRERAHRAEKSHAEALERFAASLVGDGGSTRELVAEACRALLIPSAANETEEESSLEDRLREVAAVLEALGIRGEARRTAVNEALDACESAIDECERRVADLEQRLLEGDGEHEDALNHVLRRLVAQLKHLRARQARGCVTVRVCVGTLIEVERSETPQNPKPSVPAARMVKKTSGGIFSCCSSETSALTDDETYSAYAPSESVVSAAVSNEERLTCVVRLARESGNAESYSSTSQSVLDSTARFYAMTPALTGSWDGVIEISFYGARSSDAVTDSGTSDARSRMRAAVGASCSVMRRSADALGDHCKGRATIKLAELSETTRKDGPHELRVPIERPTDDGTAKKVAGEAVIYVDKFIETFQREGAPVTSGRGDILRDMTDLHVALRDARVANGRHILSSVVQLRGGCYSVPALAEIFTLASAWRFNVDYLKRLRRPMMEVSAAHALGRLTSTEKECFERLTSLMSTQIEYELRHILPSAKVAEQELVDALDMEESAKIARAAIPLFALTLGGISGTRFIIRLKKIVRESARMRCTEHLFRENRTHSPPTVAGITNLIRKAMKRLPLDGAILSVFPSEVDALSEAIMSMTTMISDIFAETFRVIRDVRDPPEYDSAMMSLDNALSTYRKLLKHRNLRDAMIPISSRFIDVLLQPALDETLAKVRDALVDWVKWEMHGEKSNPIPIDVERGAMHSMSCVNIFCVLYNINKAAQIHLLHGDRAALNATLLSRMCYEVLQTYVDVHEASCLESIQKARSSLMKQATGQITAASRITEIKSLVDKEFYTRLSNIHQCVLTIEPFMEEMPLLWCSSKAEFAAMFQNHKGPEYAMDDDQNIFDDDPMFKDDRVLDADFFAIRIVQKLRTARANVIASLTEFVEERIAPFVRVAILEEEPKIRSGAVKIIFSMIDSELKLMDERLSSGAFRLVLSSMHRGVCDAIEQLVLHRPMEEGSLESHENWKGLPKLTETQHSLVVELVTAFRDFFHCDGAGEPISILKTGEGRLRRLLDLWFTPTVEVVREFWQLKSELKSAIAAAGGKQIRVREIGGVSVQDILRFLQQRSNDKTAIDIYNEQSKVIMRMTLGAVFGSRMTSVKTLMGAWVCRDSSGLIGRFCVTSTQLAFSTSGTSIDHPHDSQTAIVREIRRIANITRIDAADGTPGVRITFDDRQSFVFSEFCGMHTELNIQARERDSCVAVIRTNPCFLLRPVYIQDVQVTQISEALSETSDAEDLVRSAHTMESPKLPVGDDFVTDVVCARVHGLSRDMGKFTVASESCLFLPVRGPGVSVTYTSLVSSSQAPQIHEFGWRSADIIVPIRHYDEPFMRLTTMTTTQASRVFIELTRAIEAFKERKASKIDDKTPIEDS